MGAKMNIIAAILFVENFAVSGHKHGHGIRKQQHPGGDRPSRSIETRVAHARVLEIDRVHEMVQSHVRVAAAQACHKRREQTQKGIQRIPAKRAEEEVEPNHVGLKFVQRLQNTNHTRGIVERPAAFHVEALKLRRYRRYFVGQNRKAEEWIAAQLFGNVKAVFAKPTLARRESGYQADFH
ncbi:MAG: hypothetical protein ABR874_04275 [Candidatus Sulfotelmatobacter sp.]|jgi:hypothetical protein